MVGTYLFAYFFDLLLIIITHILYYIYINTPYKWYIINNLNKKWNKIYKTKCLRD